MTSAPDPKPVLAPLGEQGQISAREVKEGVTPQSTPFRVLTDSLELQKVDLQTDGVFGSGSSGEEEGSGPGPQVGAGLGAQGTSLLESLCLPYQGSEDTGLSVSLPWGPWGPSFWHWLQA